MNDSDANAVEGAVAETSVETPVIPEIKEEPYNPAMDEKYRFDLTVWLDGKTPEEHFAEAEKFIKDFPKYKGRLADKESAREALTYMLGAQRSFSRCNFYCAINFYANMSSAEAKKLYFKCNGLGSELSVATAFVDPEILALSEETIKDYKAANWFEGSEQFFDNINRYRPYVRSIEVEEVLAAYGEALSTISDKMENILSSNIPWKTVTLSDGTQFLCNIENYADEGRRKENLEDRKLIYETFLGTLKEHASYIADVLEATKQMQHITAKQKKFDSAYEQVMFDYRVGNDFFPTLKTRVKVMLPSLHRFLKIKARMLRKEKLHYYDLFVSGEMAHKPAGFDIEESIKIIREVMSFMPKEYTDKIAKMTDLSNKYIDVYPRPGKMNGAFCSSPFDGPARFLLNHTKDSIYPVSTFIHEMGHAIQREMSYENNNMVTWNFPGLVVEIPSMFPELVFAESMISKNDNPTEKLDMQYEMLDGIRTGVFRQMIFAEFEEFLFSLVQEHKPFVVEELAAKYLALLKEYYGDVVEIPDIAGYEFLYVSHFSMNWYLPKYIFSGLSGWLMYAAIKSGSVTLDNFVQMHKMGGRVPEALSFVERYGLDLSSQKAYDDFDHQYNKYMDEMEQTINQLS